MGVVRSYRLLEDCYGALWFERSRTPAWGINGGKDGQGPDNDIIHPDGRVEKPLKMRARRFEKGTLFVTRTGGGGGNGNPKARPVEEVLHDVVAGAVSRDAALSQYGVALNEDLPVDIARTAARA